MSSDFVLVEIKCNRCGHTFHPYGYRRVKPPPFGDYNCPVCGNVNRRIYDPEIKREMARKDLGLPDLHAESIAQIKTLQAEIDSLRARLDKQQDSVEKLTKRINELIPEVRKQVAEAITNLINTETKAKNKNNPLAR